MHTALEDMPCVTLARQEAPEKRHASNALH